MSIHRSLTDDDGTINYLVPRFLYLTMLAMIFVGFMTLSTLGWLIWNLNIQVEAQEKQYQITLQRRAANDEMLINRQRVQAWTFEEMCKWVKSQGRECLSNPNWWADPKRYPLLTGDNAKGTGLFPPDAQ